MLLKKQYISTLLLVAATIAAILSNILFDFDILQPLEHKVYDSMTRSKHPTAWQLALAPNLPRRNG